MKNWPLLVPALAMLLMVIAMAIGTFQTIRAKEYIISLFFAAIMLLASTMVLVLVAQVFV